MRDSNASASSLAKPGDPIGKAIRADDAAPGAATTAAKEVSTGRSAEQIETSAVGGAAVKPRSYEKYWDMPLGGTSTEEHIPRGFARVIVRIVSVLCKILFRYRVDNRENLSAFKDKTGVVVVCNHTSFLDVVFIYMSVWPEMWPRLIARNTLFDGKPFPFGWALSRVGAFPIKRDTADRTAIKRATKMLKNNEVVCILPEGTRRGKGSKTPQIHGGAALIARMGRAPIVPMTVRDAENVKQKGKFIRFPKITTELGDPIELEDFNFLPKQDRLDGCMWYAMRECFALSKRIPADQVDMNELFPGSKDFSEVFKEHPVVRHTTSELVAKLDGKAAAKRIDSAFEAPAKEGA